MEPNLYDILELTPQATPEEVRHAYFRLVDQYPPDQYPDQFTAIGKAYEVLSDPKRRAAYDGALADCEWLERLEQEACQHRQNKNWKSAVNCFRRLTEINPLNLDYQEGLGQCYMKMGAWEQAIAHYGQLVKQAARKVELWKRLGLSHLGLANTKGGSHLASAKEAFQHAWELDPKDRETYYAMAFTYVKLNQQDDAISWLERGLEANSPSTLEDLDLYDRLLLLYASKGEMSAARHCLQRLVEITGDDEVARQHVADRLANTGMECMSAGDCDSAHFFFEEARGLCPRKELADFFASLRDLAEVHRSLGALHKKLLPAVFDLVLTVVENYQRKLAHKPFSEKQIDKKRKQLTSALRKYPAETVLWQIRSVELSCPAVLRLSGDFFEEIKENLTNPTNPGDTQKKAITSGYTFKFYLFILVVMAIGGAIGAFVEGPMGALIGAFIGGIIGKARSH